MIDLVRDLQAKAQAVQRALSSTSSARVSNLAQRETVRSFVDAYFQDSRPDLTQGGLPGDVLTPVDQGMQHLVELAQGRSAKKSYVATLRGLRRDLNSLEVEILPRLTGSRARLDQTFAPRDREILTRLDDLCPTAAASYRQGILDLQGPERASWRGPATEFREALREVLDCLAPDAKVTAEPGFKFEKGRDRPTRRQKTTFIFRSQQRSEAAARVAEQAADIVDELVGRFVGSVYSEAARGTHGKPTRDVLDNIKGYVEAVLADLLQLGG